MIDWRHWHNEPYLTGGLILLGWLYALLAGPLRGRWAPGQPFPTAKAWLFGSSLVVFYLAVGSPLDQVGEHFLLSAHMVQHQLLIYLSPVLFLLGLPGWMVDPVLGAPALRRLGRLVLHPLTCLLAATVVITVWHAPVLYEWTLQDKLVHVAEHLMFFGVSLMYWWPLLSPSAVYPRSSPAVGMLYLFATEILMIPVAAYITFSGEILYPTYLYAPRIIAGFNPADDQLTAGLIMKLVGMGVSLAAFGWLFYGWYRTSERTGGGRAATGALAPQGLGDRSRG